MNPTKCIFTVCLPLLLLAAPLAAENQWTAYGDKQVHSTRLLARFRGGAADSVRSNLLAQSSERMTRSFPLVPGLVVLEPDSTAARRAAGAPAAKNPAAALRARIAALMASGRFEYVEPDYELKATLVPNDSRFVDGTLWGLKNSGQSGGLPGADIGAEAAWNVTTGSVNVVVAVIDSGIRHTHQDLAAQMWTNPGEVAGNGLDDDGDGYVDNVYGINAITGTGNPVDDNDHGTHCAGTIGAAANDGNPHVGVAWKVKLMVCKFLDANGSGATSDAIESINFAVANGAKILNNSWGGGSYQQSLFDAIANARDQGVLFVAAAGNGGEDGIGDNNDASPFYPASYTLDNVISVAALDRSDNLASFSNYGQDSVHVGAPGVSIFSSTSGADNEYKIFDGTSMATPHVSGVAALIRAKFPGISLSELRQRILLSTVPVPALSGKTQTGGRVNAFNALTMAADSVLELSISAPQGTVFPAGGSVPVYVRVTDLTNVNNAIVSGTIPGQGSVSFLDNGVAPDETAADAVYSANIVAPASGTNFILTVAASAPGRLPATNTLAFSIVQVPPNDAFANAIVIDPAGGSVSGENIYATSQPSEPTHCGAGGGKSVWWRWTAPKNQITTISTFGSDFDTILAVYTGNSVSALTNVACNDEVPGGFHTSEVIFQASAGATYRIAVDGYLGDEGHISLAISETPPATNNNFASRTAVTGINQVVRSSNFGATREGAEPYHCSVLGGASVWWTWTAPTNGVVTISTSGSTFDTVLAVYTGSSYAALSSVDCNDDRIADPSYYVVPQPVLTSEVSFSAVAGTTYQIAVDGYSDIYTPVSVGNVTLSILMAPKNDMFTNRIVISGALAQTNGYNIGASREAGEPNHASGYGDQSVWWSWTAPASGNASVTTWGSSFDTTLGVYTGNSVAGLTLIVDNDDEFFPVVRTSKAIFAATAGITYHFAVDGFQYYFSNGFDYYPAGTDAGLILLSVSLDGKSRLDDLNQRQDGFYQFNLLGDSGRWYTIESSGDLKHWTSIGDVFMNTISTLFTDTNSPAVSNQFYRAYPAPLVQ
jgi:subtilisin family serine protease